MSRWARHVGVAYQELQEAFAALPRLHGAALHHAVGRLARHPRLDQRQQDPLRVDQPAQLLEVFPHGLGINDQLVDDAGQADQREVEGDGGIGSDDPLHRGVRDIALVPQRHVLEGGDHRGAHDASQPGEVLRQHGVALVWHCRGALLAGPEALLDLADLGSLQVADLGRQTLHRGGDHGEGREELRVAVAGDDLGGHRLDLETKLPGHVFLDAGVDVGEGADGPGDGAGGDFGAGGLEPAAVALELGMESGELEAEGGGLGVNSVAAPDAEGVLVLDGALPERRQQAIDVIGQDVGRPGELQGEAGVQHVRRRHALVDESCFGSHMLGEIGQERDHVVVGLPLDLVDPRHLEPAPLPHRLGGGLRNHPEFGHRVAGVGLDLEPDAEPVLRLPDGGHLRAAVPGNHDRSPFRPARWPRHGLAMASPP